LIIEIAVPKVNLYRVADENVFGDNYDVSTIGLDDIESLLASYYSSYFGCRILNHS
jgi:hypothetical protein